MANKSKKGPMKQLSSTTANDVETSKKPSMKTASDVISRLLWDDSLPQENFSVGYLDRFDGVIEKSFESLDWRDPATVDNNTLALPKHRIQYFKYLGRKVWDKTIRKDIVFGSTGYLLSIHEFMSKVESDIENFRDEDDFPVASTTPNVLSDDADEVASVDEAEFADRPNFFVAVRIVNEDTVKNLREVTDYIQSKDEIIGECCIPAEMFHLTLSILKLDSPDDVCEAKEALKSVSLQKLPPIKLNLEGLDNFKQRVLYARVEENEALMTLRSKLVDELVSRKLQITDRFSFVPHVTVAKLSRPMTRLRHSKYIDQYLYLKYEDNEFGKEDVINLCLCEMGAERREDGFYLCACEVSLNQNA